MTDNPVWQRDGRDWPNRDSSRFVRAAGMSWHVQEMGHGPVLLLLHGTGSSTHSWRAFAPLLAAHFNVVAIDLPGHGFTQSPPRDFLSLYGMGVAISSLLRDLGKAPGIVVGHSAGAAIAARMSLDNLIAPDFIVGMNAALLPLQGAASQMFAPLARVLTRLAFVPHVFAWRANDPSMIDKMIGNTGSRIDREGIALYRMLAQKPSHVAAALGMMAEWDLPGLQRDLPRLKPPLLLITGSNDRMIAPRYAEQVRAIVPGSSIVMLDGLGHLAHEECPAMVTDIVTDAARTAGLLPAGPG